MPLPFVRKDMKVAVVRLSSDVYVIRCLGFSISEFPSRSTARIAAKDINRFLRRCSSGTGTDPEALALFIGNWFTTAVTSTGAVIPPPVIGP